jgi:D-alanine--poly(phosphoribitol) ligase subunit 2
VVELEMARMEKIKSYIEDRFLVDIGSNDIAYDADLFKAGVMDSFGYLQLMDFLETEFDISISSDEILTNVSVSLASIDAFVAEKMDARSR